MSLATLGDGALVARCRQDDDAAWHELVARFSRYIYAIATRAYRLSPEDAEDVFQEVFARTYQRLDELRDDDAIRPWIGQMTRRLAIDRLRRTREQATGEDFDVPEVDEALERLDDSLTVHAALATLPENCREILDRFFARDETYATIGDALSLPSGTIASRISRCLGKLREALEGRNVSAGASGLVG